MPVMSTCLGRLGSRYSMILDPIRREVHYGSLGLMCQREAELVIGIETGTGKNKVFETLPLTRTGEPFYCVDQHQTMTAVRYEAHSKRAMCGFEVTITAPFWPGDEKTSLVPAYLVDIRLFNHPVRLRWEHPSKQTVKTGKVRVGLVMENAKIRSRDGAVRIDYDVHTGDRFTTGEGVGIDFREKSRHIPTEGKATDLFFPLVGDWRSSKGELTAAFDLTKQDEQRFRFGMASYMGDALLERFGVALPLKYTKFWESVDDVADYVRNQQKRLLERSGAFDAIWTDAPLLDAGRNLTALSFQSYLGCTVWAVTEDGSKIPGRDGKPTRYNQWFSVWEGSCWYNSTVDVTFQESAFYFACWPELLEMLFEQWSQHANDYEGEKHRRSFVSDDEQHGNPLEQFPGAILEHDMGAGWTVNGQSYHHAMPVEENANYLILLYAHGVWWGKPELFKRYTETSKALAEYLLWTDSTGTHFPDKGTANTIDDATPAVQYGRDNVYLDVKRLAALHAAARMFEHVGETTLARKCKEEVRAAVKYLNDGWLEDHFPVCLDKSAKGLADCWTGEPLPYDELPGWDAYSLYTTNGLVPLLMIDDLPAGLSEERLREDLVNTVRASLRTYGCGHSSLDDENMWVSMNVWRDLAGAYLGVDLRDLCEKYWGQQLFANGPGSEKPNCFTETSLTNNLVWYPRNTATFGLLFAGAGLQQDRIKDEQKINPVTSGQWPLMPLTDWKKMELSYVEAE